MNKPRFIEQPRLTAGVRYRWDALREQHQLLFPEGVLALNETAAAIVTLCDGRSVDELICELQEKFPAADPDNDVHDFLARLAEKGLLCDGDA